MSDGRICSVSDCSRPLWARTLCKTHYNRWHKWGDPLADVAVLTRGGRSVMPSGYVRVWAPDHPLAHKQGYVFEHRKVLHDAGVEVPPKHHVHHINHDRADNRIENLEVVLPDEHTRRHAEERGRPACGTNGGYFRHYRQGETPCEPCRTAANAIKRARVRDVGNHRP